MKYIIIFLIAIIVVLVGLYYFADKKDKDIKFNINGKLDTIMIYNRKIDTIYIKNNIYYNKIEKIKGATIADTIYVNNIINIDSEFFNIFANKNSLYDSTINF